MKSQRVIHGRKQSPPARCTQRISGSVVHHRNGNPHDNRRENLMVMNVERPCGAEMQLVIKYPKVWSYQERVSERCLAGHIAHAQAVVDVEDDSEDCWGAF